MCGIAGIFGFEDQQIDKILLRAMNEQLVHRGPDADGFYLSRHVGMCMRRLKVIDLSTGNQPIANGNKTLWIVFNGEIYNYRELRDTLIKKGHQFQTHSDTEVIVHLYQEYGERCVEQLIGMFAFSIYDVNKDEMFIARDRLGVKPLFYAKSPQGLVYGSEIKAILKAPWIKRELDPVSISHYLSLNYLPAPCTPLKGIQQLEPGHWMRISKGNVEVEKYWDISLSDISEDGEEAACKKILELLHRSMERRLIADVPIGAFLSGGLDSSMLVWLMKEHRHDQIKTFSVGFDEPGYDETPYAREVANFFGTKHFEIRCTPQDVINELPKVAWHADNLLADQAALPLYLVSQLAKKEVTVCLSGDGGDEIFVGYPTFHADQYHQIYSRIPHFLRHGVIEPLVKTLPVSSGKVSFDYKARKFIEAGDFSPQKAHYWWRTIFTDDEKRALLSPEWLSQVPDLDSFEVYRRAYLKVPHADFISQSLYADLKVWLAGNNLYKVDTMSMAHGLEARVPFLDHELVEYMMGLPVSIKFRQNVLKFLLKKIAAGRLPEGIVNRKKAGFHSPIASWFRNSLYSHLKHEILDENDSLKSIFKMQSVYQVLEEHKCGKKNHAYKLWGLLVFSFWHRHFFEAL